MEIHDILKRYWGYASFRPLQEDIIRSVLAGKDTLALMPTGGGKSITYQVPGMVGDGICLVISPLIALMKDQIDDLNRRGIGAEAIYTGMLYDAIESAFNKAKAGKVKFLYISPERLASARFRERLKGMNVSLLAVDEAHCISQWGYDFRPSYLRISEVREYFPSVPVLALTATATPQVVEDIQNRLKFSAPNVLSKSFRRENITYVVRDSTAKEREICYILSHTEGATIAYVRTRGGAERLAGLLNEKGFSAEYYHGGLSTAQRSRKQETWMSGTVRVMVATNAFGMGIDKPDVRLVIHCDLPESLEAYFQEAGRAGRDGKKAYAVLLCNEANMLALKERVDKYFPSRKYIRQIYKYIGDYYQIEEGTGEGLAFEFDPRHFMMVYQLEEVAVFSSLNILKMAGYLECTADVRGRSSVNFAVLREALYRIELHDTFLEQIIEFLMRNCPGIFSQYVYIDEQFMADRLGVNREKVYQGLLNLSRQKIINYLPGNDRLYIVYHQVRVPASYVHIGREAYEDRKQSYAEKVESIIAYVKDKETCRQLQLMRYFGQKEKEPCGTCDNCLAKKKTPDKYTREEIRRFIIDTLAATDMSVRDLVEACDAPRKQTTECLRDMLEEGSVVYNNLLVLTLGKKQTRTTKKPES